MLLLSSFLLSLLSSCHFPPRTSSSQAHLEVDIQSFLFNRFSGRSLDFVRPEAGPRHDLSASNCVRMLRCAASLLLGTLASLAVLGPTLFHLHTVVSAAAVPSTGASLARRCFLCIAAVPLPAIAYMEKKGTLGYVDDSGQLSYSQVQRAFEKSAYMTGTEKSLAAKGVALGSREGESPQGQKRRAMAACAMDEFRKSAGYASTLECNKDVLAGSMKRILDVM